MCLDELRASRVKAARFIQDTSVTVVLSERMVAKFVSFQCLGHNADAMMVCFLQTGSNRPSKHVTLFGMILIKP